MTPQDEFQALQTPPEPPPIPQFAQAAASPEPAETRFLKWVVLGENGLRVGWSVALFLVLAFLGMGLFGAVAMLFAQKFFNINPRHLTATSTIYVEAIQLLGLLAAAAVAALNERRRILDYNLTGPNRVRHFFTGLVGGFAALSALVLALHAGGWLHFGPVSLSGATILQFGALWGIGFLLTGLGEEGMTRCYMLFTLARGINYWWAFGTVSCFSLFAYLNPQSNGSGGVYLMAALGVLPCLLLHLKKSPSAGFWESAWLTSTFFGYMHTFNAGESWIGIFSAAGIGFVFCVSVRLTGSAWWAIGFHAAWDWAQTFFYGTADSGMRPSGHYLTTIPSGLDFWSGGNAGPEGSILIVPVILLTLLALVLFYRRSRSQKGSESSTGSETPSPAAQPQLS
ncbi:CPBP family intramembrane glutamic endopeptidase [Acidicapsa ligni]|uniref:CPBP family intramembrane glutamic endopeptidase n=1 Tax=Acidicapsa ligni TaxID=542300 RepID=UPI0021E01718|nr:CPBP family intramembrane glutamic endopeptidase [Acidicapsa ligni]